MRAYFFGNFYLSSIQQGIQAQHCTAEMFLKYTGGIKPFTKSLHMLYDWAENHKTTILLNGGEAADLKGLRELFQEPENTYPWAHFTESVGALNGSLTCVGIILPKYVYESAEYFRKGVDEHEQHYSWARPKDWETDLIDALNNCSMAR